MTLGRNGELVAALFLAAACGKPSASSPEERGRAVYSAFKCGRCHRIGAQGRDTGPDLTFVGMRKSAEFLEVWLQDPSAWQPKTAMPNFRFNADQRKSLVAYLATLKGEDHRASGAPWDAAAFKSDPVKRGGEIYRRVGCATCHGRGGEGGTKNNNVPGGEIPKLTAVSAGYTKEELVTKLRLGVARPAKADPAGPEPLLNMPAWGESLTPDELEAAAEYVLSLGRGQGSGGEW